MPILPLFAPNNIDEYLLKKAKDNEPVFTNLNLFDSIQNRRRRARQKEL